MRNGDQNDEPWIWQVPESLKKPLIMLSTPYLWKQDERLRRFWKIFNNRGLSGRCWIGWTLQVFETCTSIYGHSGPCRFPSCSKMAAGQLLPLTYCYVPEAQGDEPFLVLVKLVLWLIQDAVHPKKQVGEHWVDHPKPEKHKNSLPEQPWEAPSPVRWDGDIAHMYTGTHTSFLLSSDCDFIWQLRLWSWGSPVWQFYGTFQNHNLGILP